MHSKGEVLSDAEEQEIILKTNIFSPEEMHEKFKDIPEVLTNAYELGKCNLEIETGIYVLPDFETPLNKWLQIT